MASPWRRTIDGLRIERMRASLQWRGDGFGNAHPVTAGLAQGSTLPLLREYMRPGGRRTPPAPLPAVDPRPRWSRPADSGLRATWLGHSTVLLEVDGWRVLTDPVWAARASPSDWAGPKRFQPVPIAIDALPALDAVLLSHDHYDHLDAAAVRRLAARGVPFFTALGVGAHLEAFGVPAERITELDWWESAPVDGTGLVVTAAPAQHFSGRGLGDRNATLWASLVVRGPQHAVFFSGDTGLTDAYAEVARRLGPFDLVMLEVGAFHPAWGGIHLGPENALEALRLLGGGPLLPVHWGTFALALHPWDEPAEVLLRQAPTDAPLLMPRLGEPVEPRQAGLPEPWWRSIEA